jgi:hypothetical protein
MKQGPSHAIKSAVAVAVADAEASTVLQPKHRHKSCSRRRMTDVSLAGSRDGCPRLAMAMVVGLLVGDNNDGLRITSTS